MNWNILPLLLVFVFPSLPKPDRACVVPREGYFRIHVGTSGPKEKEKDRMEVQKTMETEVLRISEYPHVTFESTGVERAGEVNRFRVRGNLTIRGKTLPVIIPVTLARLADGTYSATGEYSFKQSSFLIKPIQLGGGTVKVKDEVQTQFELFLK